jgi:hypothetical protein
VSVSEKLQINVVFNLDHYEIELPQAKLKEVTTLLKEKGGVLKGATSPVLEIEGSRLCSNSFTSIMSGAKSVENFFGALSSLLRETHMSVDIYMVESNQGTYLKYRNGVLESKKDYQE